MSLNAPKRGDLGYLDFNPQSGVEQAGHRPCLVLSPESFNETTGLAIVCPITSQGGDWPFEVPLPEHLAFKGYVLTDHAKSVDWKARNFKVKSEAPKETVEKCLDIIQTFLS